jgi:putative oxidoreductase
LGWHPWAAWACECLAYIFIIEGVGEIGSYARVTDDMQTHGVDRRLLPLVILTNSAAACWCCWLQNAMGGDCALRLLFADGRFFHTGAEQAIQLQKNIAVVGGFLALALLGPGAWSLEDWRGEPSI